MALPLLTENVEELTLTPFLELYLMPTGQPDWGLLTNNNLIKLENVIQSHAEQMVVLQQTVQEIDTSADARHAEMLSVVQNEAIERSAADGNLQSLIEAEETARIAGDANLQSQIDTLIGTSITLQGAYDNGNTIDLTQTKGSVGLSLASGSINIIEIANSGTGRDIRGTGNNWSIDSTGDAIFRNITASGASVALTVNQSGSDSAILVNGSGSGNGVEFNNSGSGYDLWGTLGAWFVDKNGDAKFNNVEVLGAITFVENTVVDTITIEDSGGGAGLLINKTGSPGSAIQVNNRNSAEALLIYNESVAQILVDIQTLIIPPSTFEPIFRVYDGRTSPNATLELNQLGSGPAIAISSSSPFRGDITLEERTSDPSAAQAGDLWYHANDDAVRYSDGTTTRTVAVVFRTTGVALTQHIGSSVVHDLGRMPQVTVIRESDGMDVTNYFDTNVEHVSSDQITVTVGTTDTYTIICVG